MWGGGEKQSFKTIPAVLSKAMPSAGVSSKTMQYTDELIPSDTILVQQKGT